MALDEKKTARICRTIERRIGTYIYTSKPFDPLSASWREWLQLSVLLDYLRSH